MASKEKKLVIIGSLLLTVPSILILFGPGLLVYHFVTTSMIWVALTVVASIVLAFVYWGFGVTKWRKWAYTKADNLHALIDYAEQWKLIYENGGGSRLEFGSVADKQIIQTLWDAKKDRIQETKAILHYSMSWVGMGAVLFLTILLVGAWLYMLIEVISDFETFKALIVQTSEQGSIVKGEKENYTTFFFALLIPLILNGLWKGWLVAGESNFKTYYQLLLDKDKALVLDELGIHLPKSLGPSIYWEAIEHFELIHEEYKKQLILWNDKQENQTIFLDHFNVDVVELRQFLLKKV